jgi:hypothetical protein
MNKMAVVSYTCTRKIGNDTYVYYYEYLTDSLRNAAFDIKCFVPSGNFHAANKWEIMLLKKYNLLNPHLIYMCKKL